MRNPLVSVLLPVYNGSRYIQAAVESILQQSWTDFELIIINDGSTDDTDKIVACCADPRIKYVEQDNAGLSATLNRAISMARGRYLARQDSDDVSLPERFAKQIAFLEANPACGMVGTWAEIWQEDRKSERVHRHPSADGVLKFELLFNNPFVHSSVMMRHEAVEAVGPYLCDRSRQLPEDYELWSRISRHYQVANIPEVLHIYREAVGSICRDNWDRLMEVVVALSADNIAYATGARCDDRQVINLAALSNAMLHKNSGGLDLSGMKRIFFLAVQKLKEACPADAEAIENAAQLKWRGVRFQYLRVFVPTPFLNLLLRSGFAK